MNNLQRMFAVFRANVKSFWSSEIAVCLFQCDPEKHTECKKHGCQKYCFMTKDPAYAVKDENLEPIVWYLRRRRNRFPDIDVVSRMKLRTEEESDQ